MDDFARMANIDPIGPYAVLKVGIQKLIETAAAQELHLRKQANALEIAWSCLAPDTCTEARTIMNDALACRPNDQILADYLCLRLGDPVAEVFSHTSFGLDVVNLEWNETLRPETKLFVVREEP